jgi:nuclear receptor subfamily 5 group A protein 2
VSGLTYRHQLEQNQEKVNAAMLEYCSTFYPGIRDKFGQLLVRLPEIRLMSLRIEDYLYYQHMNGNIPENTLLMEMLHSKRK